MTVFATATIVVIDDVPENVALLTRLLRSAGVERVHAFTSAAEALHQLDALDPDLVFLDLHMPGMNGFEFLARVTAVRPEGAFLPILVLTADISWETKRRALDLGATDFLTKPIDTDEALLRARNLLQTRALHTALKGHNARLQEQLDAATERERRRAEEHQRLAAQLDRLLAEGEPTMVFQPVIDLRSREVVGVESLARFHGESPRTPDVWFAEAELIGRGVELEMAAVRAATERLPSIPEGAFLSINVSATTALSVQLRQHLRTLPCKQIVLELTEHTHVADYDQLNEALAEHRAAGMRLAIDDTGAGFASFHHLLRLRPDIIKLDIMLTQHIDLDPARRALAVALSTFSDELGAVMIAEGVETPEELRVLTELSVPWGQGYHLGHPSSVPFPRAAYA